MANKLPVSLIEAAKDGNPQALEELVREAETVIRRIANSGSPSDADDIVQNALLRVVQSLSRLIEPAAFYGWLTTIARNEVRLIIRERLKYQQTQLDFTSMPSDFEDAGFSIDVKSAVERLPSSQQLLIRRRYVDDRTYNQMSLELSAPVSAIKSRLHRARNQLKKELDMSEMAKGITLSEEEVASLATASRFIGTLPNLSGMLLDTEGYVIATDAHRLIMRSVPSLKLLQTSLVVEPNSITALIGTAKITVRLDEVQLQLVDELLAWGISGEKFPDYKLVIPDEPALKIEVSRTSLLAGLEDMMPFLEQAHPNKTGFEYLPVVILSADSVAETVIMTTDESLGYISKNSQDRPEPAGGWCHSISVKVNSMIGAVDDLHTGIKAQYLRDALESIDADVVCVNFSANDKPIDVMAGGHRVLTMPVKID